MKTRIFLLMLLAYLSFTTSVEAQTLITSTTTSTTVIHQKSDRVKGFVIRPELGIYYGKGYFTTYYHGIAYNSHAELYGVSLNGTVGYQFNPFFSVGAGFDGLCLDSFVSPALNRNIFANLRVYFYDRYCSPYLDLKPGTKAISGEFGIQIKRFDYGVSISSDYEGNWWRLSINVAYNFQF